MIKHVNFKKRKPAIQIASKRSAVIPTLQKDPPLFPLHKKITDHRYRYHTKVSISFHEERTGYSGLQYNNTRKWDSLTYCKIGGLWILTTSLQTSGALDCMVA